MQRNGLMELPSPCCSPCGWRRSAALSAERCIESKEQGAQQSFFLHSELMSEFLEIPVKLQDKDSQTFVELLAPTCAEEGSGLEGGYQRRTETGCSSWCACTVRGSLLFYFPANTFKRLLRSGLNRLYGHAAEERRSHSAGWVWSYPKARGLSPASAGRVPGVSPALTLAMGSCWGAPGRGRQTRALFALNSLGNPGRETMSILKR